MSKESKAVHALHIKNKRHGIKWFEVGMNYSSSNEKNKNVCRINMKIGNATTRKYQRSYCI